MRDAAAALLLLISGCGADARDGESARTQSSESAPSAIESSPPPNVPKPVGAPVCLPVAACNMFISCALAQPEESPSGATSYRVLQYDHHPNQVGKVWQRDTVCWADQPGGAAKGCADAFRYRDVACTATPNAPMALQYSCKLVDQKCVAESNAAPTPPASDGTLTHAEIEKVVNDLRATARTKCWEPLAKTSGPSNAKVTMRFTIEPSGATTRVGAGGAPEFPTLSACVGKVVEAARFPAHESPVAVSVPFAFLR